MHLFYKDELIKLITEMFILRIVHDCYIYTLWVYCRAFQCLNGVKLIALTKVLEHLGLSAGYKGTASVSIVALPLQLVDLFRFCRDILICWQLMHYSQSNACFVVSEIRRGCENANGNLI
jgi:hypothetical protein